MNWTVNHDYAIAFGAGLGLSNSSIASCLGPEFNRNMVIGRRYRLGIKCPAPVRHIKPSKASSVKERHNMPKNRWTEEEDNIVRANPRMTARKLHELLPNRSNASIWTRRQCLGIASSLKRYTPADDEIIRADYAAYVPVGQTASKLGRSPGVLRRRIVILMKAYRRDNPVAKQVKMADEPNRRWLVEKFEAMEAELKELKGLMDKKGHG